MGYGATKVLYPNMPSSDRLETAKHYLKQMIFGVETRPKGFDYNGIIWLVENWLMFIKNFRGPGDVGPMHSYWFRRHTLRPVPAGRKRSAHLVVQIKLLQQFLHPGEQNMQGLYEVFDETRTQMFELVEDFRKHMEEMEHEDLPKLLAELERVTNRAKARWQ